MAISYSISDSRPRCYGLIGSSSRISCVNSCQSLLSNELSCVNDVETV